MVSERQLEMIRQAFEELAEVENLNGWGLDPMGWNFNSKLETHDVDLHLLKGERERTAITILPMPGDTAETLKPRILNVMVAAGLIEG